MAYQINYVDNTGSEGLAHWQLLKVIKTFAEANGWVTQRYTTPTDGSPRQLILKGEGLSGTEEIFIGFRTYHDVGADYYNVSAAAFTGYVDGNAFDAQPGYVESGIPAHNRRIDYWLVANAQRITFGLKVGTPVYVPGYAGKFFPDATPGQYPYPVVVGGMLDGIPPTRFSDPDMSIPYKGARPNFRMRFVDGAWLQPECWPWNCDYLTGTTQIRDTGTNYKLLAIELNDEAGNIYGTLDGVFAISGFDNTVESTLTIDDVDYIVLQDVGRTGFVDYYVMRLD